jgi:hypothetical protein
MNIAAANGLRTFLGEGGTLTRAAAAHAAPHFRFRPFNEFSN